MLTCNSLTVSSGGRCGLRPCRFGPTLHARSKQCMGGLLSRGTMPATLPLRPVDRRLLAAAKAGDAAEAAALLAAGGSASASCRDPSNMDRMPLHEASSAGQAFGGWPAGWHDSPQTWRWVVASRHPLMPSSKGPC